MPADTVLWPAAAAPAQAGPTAVQPIQMAGPTGQPEAWPKAEPRLRAPRWNLTWSWNRVVAGGASLVSFASMIVAMGPILNTVETNDAGAIEGDNLEATGAVNPAAPAVDIQVDPNSAAAVPPAAAPLEVTTETVVVTGQSVDGAESTVGAEAVGANPAAVATPDAAAPDGVPPQTEAPAAAPPQTEAPPRTEAPATAPAQAEAPATAPPQTQAPTTAPPATQAPTAPPQTQAPTTAPPATQAPAATPPPRSEGSGG